MSRTVPGVPPNSRSAGSGATGAGTPRQFRPPSSVRTTDVHGARWHGASPSTYAVRLDVNVTDHATKPRGTGPPTASPADAALTGAVDSAPAELPLVDVPPVGAPAPAAGPVADPPAVAEP